ncbi:hypothetical protein IAT38_001800 [Cryptococcus sp. DSM 104549]
MVSTAPPSAFASSSSSSHPHTRQLVNVRFHPPRPPATVASAATHAPPRPRTPRLRSPPPSRKKHHHLHNNPRAMLRPAVGEPPAPPPPITPAAHAHARALTPHNPRAKSHKYTSQPHPSTYWRDYYAPPPLDDSAVLPKPTSKIKYYSSKWKLANPNPKSREGAKAFYGNGMMGGGMYPGMMGGMGGGMYPGMMGGMGPGMYGMGGMGGMGMMGGGYGIPRYGGMYGGGYGGYGGAYNGMYDPMMGTYGAPPAANFVDDNPDAHRIEHAYRQSMPDSYGVGMSMLPGGMGINNLPGSQVMLYGRGMPYNGWYA